MAMIERTNALGLIPEPVSREIIDGVRQSSVAMRLMRRLPNMTAGTVRQPVLSLLPVADFVNGDAGMKITSNAAWDRLQLVAAEIATIIPIPQAVFDDADYNIWDQIRPLIVEAMGRVFDKQVFSGGNPKAPTEWPTAIIPGATAAGNVVAQGTGVDVAADLGAAMGMVEADSYDVTGIAAQRSLRGSLRNLRASSGAPIYAPLTDAMPDTIYGVPTYFVGAGTWDATKAIAIVGEWENAVYSVRQDITYQIFDTGVISDDAGAIVYNLLQQDMIAMRAVMRIAWQLAQPANVDRVQGAATNYPFALLTPAAG